MTKQPSRCYEDDDPLIKTNQKQRGCTCSAASQAPKETAPFPFKEQQKTALPVSVENRLSTISSDSSESTLSVVDISSPSAPTYELPMLSPREHGPHCALEVSVLEKHAEGCSYKKHDREGRNPIDDKVGSYDVVGRMVYRTCTGTGNGTGDSLKGSAKGFRLNDPTFFGKELKEQRSRVETIPLLPNYDNCVMRLQTPKKTNSFQAMYATDEPEPLPIHQNEDDNLEVLSVYIRRDKNEEVPYGFQKLHYRGDSCKLHDPNERSRQILALQKVINETSSGAALARSNRRFSPVPERETQIMTAIASPAKIPTTLYAPRLNLEESEESLESFKNPKNVDDPNVYNEPFDLLPPHKSSAPHRTEDEDSRIGLFGCFRRKSKRQQQDFFITEERNTGSKRVTHSDNQPRRGSSPPQSNYRELSAQYSTKRNL